MQLQQRKHLTWGIIVGGITVLITVGVALLSLLPGGQFHTLKNTGVYNKTWYVSSKGSDKNDGLSVKKPLATLQKALTNAQPGNLIELADGEYSQSVTSVRSGTKQQPIVIHGGRAAVLKGANNKSRIFEIRHSYLTLNGFTIDGQKGLGTSKSDFHDKLIYAIGSQLRKGVQGLKIDHMLLQNAGGECVRLRYFAVDNEISNSTIKNCGIYDFRFADGGKNGEGIYIGTAPEQRADGKNPTAEPDNSTGNRIHHNTIETHGNECVDIKEGATKNLVEYNTCREQQDPNSGGFDSRGEYNTFRFNTIENNKGAGVRLGGDADRDGIFNNVYNNTITGNAGPAFKIERLPQGKICSNTVRGNAGYTNEKSKSIDPTSVCQ